VVLTGALSEWNELLCWAAAEGIPSTGASTPPARPADHLVVAVFNMHEVF
jgi:hypothetical protein